MANSVTITGSPTIVALPNYLGSGVTYYAWTFPVVVNGAAGLITYTTNTNDLANLDQVSELVINALENDPGLLGGIAGNDGPGTADDRGDEGQGGDGPGEDGDDDDGQLAGDPGDGDGYGDSV